MELLIFALSLLTLGVLAAQVGVDSRPGAAEPTEPGWWPGVRSAAPAGASAPASSAVPMANVSPRLSQAVVAPALNPTPNRTAPPSHAPTTAARPSARRASRGGARTPSHPERAAREAQGAETHSRATRA
jgi:hypothetical protein